MRHFYMGFLTLGVLTLRSVPVHADLRLTTEDQTQLKELLAGYEGSREQSISRAIDLLLTPNGLEEMIRQKQEAEAQPRLDQIRERVTGARIEYEGYQERVVPSRPFSWRDGHFLDDYSLQTSTEYVSKIAAQYRKTLTKFLRQQGILEPHSPVSLRIREDIHRAHQTACQVLKNL